MNIAKHLLILAFGTFLISSQLHADPHEGKIFVVLSSETALPLKDGRTFRTGYYLNELIVPAQKLSAAGYELVFANPTGNTPEVDTNSVDAAYFGGSKEALEAAQQFKRTLGGLSHPLTLKQVAQGDLSQYRVVFVPGGPAPMIDLMASAELGSVLGYFHRNHMTTVLLCHGPVALAAATHDPVAYQQALRSGNEERARHLALGWPYAGYQMTVFSDEEEVQAAANVFHGDPQFLPQRALTIAGGNVAAVPAWHSNVVQDRELITGQNPFSDAALTEVLLRTLSAPAH